MYRKNVDLYKSITMTTRGHPTLQFTTKVILKAIFSRPCHIQFLKQNSSYCVSVLKVTSPLLSGGCLHHLTLKSPRGF